MSTCPNKDLFSAYIDGELSSPWKERLEQHLRECGICRQIYGHYTAVRYCIRLTSSEKELDTEASFAKLAAKHGAIVKIKQENRNKKNRLKTGERWLYASIRVPVPLAAAAVFIFIFMPLILFFRMGYSDASNRESFTPILPLPVSLEKQKLLPEMDYCILCTDDIYEYALPNKALITHAKLFTVSEFTRLYSENGNMFQPTQYTVDLRISSSKFPFATDHTLMISNQ